MKYCSHCGKEVDDNAYVCPNCGCKIHSDKDESLSVISIVGFIFAFIMPLVGLIVSIVAHNNAKSCDDEKSRKFAKTGIIIAICFIAFYVLIVGAVSCASCALIASYAY